MSEKPTRNQRRKLAEAARARANPAPTPGEIVRQRRKRRLIFLAAAAIAFPLLEVVAYRYRSILIIVTNASDEVVTNVKFRYPGGSFEAKELKPGGEITHIARPDFAFTRDGFSTYSTRVSAFAASGAFNLMELRAGTIDYSARETYAIEPSGETKALRFKHTTQPGFPLGAIRDLLTRLGLR